VQRTPSKQSPSSPFGGAGSASDSSDYNTFGTVRVINLPTYLQDPFPDGRTRDVGNAHSPTSPSGRQPPEAATKKPKHKKKQKQDGKPGKDHQPSSSTDDLVGRRASDAPSPSIAPFTWKKGRLLGKGAFGSVYEGLTSSGKIIAVKHLELAADVNPEKSSHYQTFRKEIELLKSFKHANIVQYYGSHIEKNNIYVFLEYVPGGSISSMLSKYGQFDEELIRVYAQQILLGLRYLHANRVAHRDIKGANILVDTKGHAKLADFGCSKSIEGIVSEMFNTMLGTPYWMAPEVMRQEGHGRKADIWSFACTIIEMASGKPPWADQYTQVRIEIRF
jgi:serine/threonine protein kinase